MEPAMEKDSKIKSRFNINFLIALLFYLAEPTTFLIRNFTCQAEGEGTGTSQDVCFYMYLLQLILNATVLLVSLLLFLFFDSPGPYFSSVTSTTQRFAANFSYRHVSCLLVWLALFCCHLLNLYSGDRAKIYYLFQSLIDICGYTFLMLFWMQVLVDQQESGTCVTLLLCCGHLLLATLIFAFDSIASRRQHDTNWTLGYITAVIETILIIQIMLLAVESVVTIHLNERGSVRGMLANGTASSLLGDGETRRVLCCLCSGRGTETEQSYSFQAAFYLFFGYLFYFSELLTFSTRSVLCSGNSTSLNLPQPSCYKLLISQFSINTLICVAVLCYVAVGSFWRRTVPILFHFLDIAQSSAVLFWLFLLASNIFEIFFVDDKVLAVFQFGIDMFAYAFLILFWSCFSKALSRYQKLLYILFVLHILFACIIFVFNLAKSFPTVSAPSASHNLRSSKLKVSFESTTFENVLLLETLHLAWDAVAEKRPAEGYTYA